MKILVADDETVSRRMLQGLLTKWGYEVVSVEDGAAAWEQLSRPDAPRLALLDWMMPGQNGVDVCRQLRRERPEPYTYLVLLTARDAKEYVVEGLESGADDYLTKPFEFRELLARLRALLRRSGELRPPRIVVADLVLDTAAQTVSRAGRPIPLTAKEYALLEFLARNAGRVVGRAEIAEHVWDESFDPFSNLIEVYVNRVRRKIDAGSEHALLHTRRGAGYLFGDLGDLSTTDSQGPQTPSKLRGRVDGSARKNHV